MHAEYNCEQCSLMLTDRERISELFLYYRVRHNYDIQGLMERYKFSSLSAINLTRG